MLGDELRKAREDADLTQEAVSATANIDRSYLSQLDNNKKSPAVDLLFRICDALKIAPSEILARVEKTRPKPKPKHKVPFIISNRPHDQQCDRQTRNGQRRFDFFWPVTALEIAKQCASTLTPLSF
jgi:transcriptional regulator with XRE-family HTH domain